MSKSYKQLRKDNAMLRFQVDELWKAFKDARTRQVQSLYSKRVGSKIKQDIIDTLKAELEAAGDADTHARKLALLYGEARRLLKRVLQIRASVTDGNSGAWMSAHLAGEIKEFLDE